MEPTHYLREPNHQDWICMSNDTQNIDIEIMEKIMEGDAMAFEQFYCQYYGRIYTIALRYLKVSELAEDIAQHCFTKVWEKRSSLADVDNFNAWFFRMVRNVIIDYFRKKINEKKYQQSLIECFSAEWNNPEEQLINRQQREIIRESVNNLSAKQRLAYLLSREKGLSYREIADEMNISLNTVKVHISAALKQIKKHLILHRIDVISILVSFAFLN